MTSTASAWKRIRWMGAVCATATALLLAVWFTPTTRAGTSLGGPLSNLSATELNLFNKAIPVFNLSWNVSQGLGPVFTNQGCRACHFTPATGGNSSQKNTLYGTVNPDGSFNYLTNLGGPLLHPQSISQFAPSCTVSGEVLPSQATVVSKRLVPMLFGVGLIDAISDATIEANSTNQTNDPFAQSLGIHGVPNMSTDIDGVTLRPGRFGFKAFRPTLLQLVADALQHDVGVTNPINPNEDLPGGNPIPQSCKLSALTPDDKTGVRVVNLFWFPEFLAPNQAAPLSANTLAGQQTFQNIGCAVCHIPSLVSGANVQVPLAISSSTGVVTKTETSAALSNQTVNLYSDLLLHDMGPGLADGFPQIQASGSQWRTTPLWGVSLRTLFLHDGRARDLTTAILNHGGEAQTVINNFQTLSTIDQANLVAFLQTL